MKITFRWYGSEEDTIPLEYIRQIPGITGVVSALFDIPVGEIWPIDRIMRLKEEVNSKGLELEVIESVNIHEDIKLGLPTREKYIKNYQQTLINLAKAEIKVVCYNFMPVFDWTRSDLSKELSDGSKAFSYDENIVNKIQPSNLADKMGAITKEFSLPGWEPERLEHLQILFDKYKYMSEEKLFENLEYFLKKIIPIAEEHNIKMAIHPDDPPWSIFGLPRIVTNKENLNKIMNMVVSPYNGLTLCSGCLGANLKNDIPEMIRYFGSRGRIHFGHVRNIKIHAERVFDEPSHLSSDGSLDLFEIMKAYHDIGFNGYIRPDHGRMIWGETGRPAYGLYDRALGITYINGLWEAISKMEERD